jgi:DNA-binding IclR family transcriptional regulator
MIQSLLKAVDLLEAFSIGHSRYTLAGLADRTGYPKTTIHTILKTLESRGYVERVGESYALGSAVISLSQAALANVEIRDRAAPLLRQMADELGESVYLTVPGREHILYIYAIESSQRLEARSAIGDVAYYHSTSVGKAILAHLPSARVSEILDEVGLPQRTPTTIVSREKLLTELARIKEQGFATDHSENERETYCVGAPVFDASHQVVGSCSVSGNSPRIVGEELDHHAKVVVSSADAISKRLGYMPRRDKLTELRLPQKQL